MFRKAFIDLLLNQPRTIAELAILMEMKPRDVEDDLRHLLLSLKHSNHRTVIEPARCRHCGFTFAQEKLRKPGKCPACKRTWISEPRIHLKTP